MKRSVVVPRDTGLYLKDATPVTVVRVVATAAQALPTFLSSDTTWPAFAGLMVVETLTERAERTCDDFVSMVKVGVVVQRSDFLPVLLHVGAGAVGVGVGAGRVGAGADVVGAGAGVVGAGAGAGAVEVGAGAGVVGAGAGEVGAGADELGSPTAKPPPVKPT